MAAADASGVSSDWSLLVFGDSWAAHEFCDSWPEVLGQRLSATVFNFAQGGSTCKALAPQAETALKHKEVPRDNGGLLHPKTLVVVHSCGNDFIFKLIFSLYKGGVLKSEKLDILGPNAGVYESSVLARFLHTMHEAGARHFLVSGVPVTLRLPALRGAVPHFKKQVDAGKLEAIGVSPGSPAERVLEVQSTALRERWLGMIGNFRSEHPEATCVFFDEVQALEDLREALGAKVFDESMWDFTKLHPNLFGHTQIAAQAHRDLARYIPALATGASAASGARSPSSRL